MAHDKLCVDLVNNIDDFGNDRILALVVVLARELLFRHNMLSFNDAIEELVFEADFCNSVFEDYCKNYLEVDTSSATCSLPSDEFFQTIYDVAWFRDFYKDFPSGTSFDDIAKHVEGY